MDGTTERKFTFKGRTFALKLSATPDGCALTPLYQCLDAADRFGFRLCYVELKSAQTAMVELLERDGFKVSGKPLRDPTDPSTDAYHYINLASH